jgi:hypothetical protein
LKLGMLAMILGNEIFARDGHNGQSALSRRCRV